jgi:acyl-CoA reductase-like NAD-dependent aldehyde dehydrogenase
VKANLIDGEWVAGESVADDVNPSDTNEIVGRFAQATERQVGDAVGAATAAFATWRRSPIQQRFDVLDRAGSEILARREELGALLSREEGKTLAEGIGEVERAGRIFKFFAAEALRIPGEFLDSVRPGVEVTITREPTGPIGIITPWNFPAAIPAWKIAPALAFGNTVVFKPAALVPASAWAIVDVLHRAGLPHGVLNLVMGAGGRIGRALVEDQRIRAITFTGSVATGTSVARSCAARGAKYQLEMGGKNPLVVLDDANIETAVSCAVNGAFFSTGQRCTASSRLIVTAGIHDQFVDALAKRIRSLVIGHALTSGVEIGPVVDGTQLEQDLRYIDVGRGEGATLLCGGTRLERATPGYYFSPALFVDATNDMRINREEIFGPVAAVIKVASFEEALAIANDTPFGLCAGICTQSLRNAAQFRREAQAGMVMVNLPTAGVDYHVPFGGSKQSSFGPREQGTYAVEFYATVKTIYCLPAG